MAHIAVQQLLAEGEHDDKVAGMNRMLAFRTLGQTPIESSADLRFMMQLYSRQSQAKDILDQFEAFKTQEDSKVAKQALSDWQFTRKRIELCIVEAKWEDLYTLCASLLREDASAESADGKKGGSFRYVEWLQRIHDSHTDLKQTSRRLDRMDRHDQGLRKIGEARQCSYLRPGKAHFNQEQAAENDGRALGILVDRPECLQERWRKR